MKKQDRDNDTTGKRQMTISTLRDEAVTTDSTTTSRTSSAIGMFAILLLLYGVNAMDRNLFFVLTTDIRQALNLSLPEIGLASTIFTLGMGIAGVPAGFLLAKLPRKGVAILGTVIFSGATLCTAYVSGLHDLLLCRFITGLGEAMQLTAILAIGTTYFARNRAMAASAMNFVFGIGATVGPNLGAAILHFSDWQMPFIVFGLVGIPFLLATVLMVRPWFSEAGASEEASVAAMREGVSDTVFSPRPLLLAAATVFAGLALFGYLGLYSSFLREQVGFTARQAALAIGCYGSGALIALVGGWLGDRYDYHKLLRYAFLAAAVIGGGLFTECHSACNIDPLSRGIGVQN
ncbi:MFS transporter [Bradyrhizobium sp. 41S5]|uniref:MFS transporter n=1 Tax=Bradyrhizobium sp. 41S5 TaxID=1404443 RepID=UPI001AEF33C7|nr:MFS transporter [Bradyrhizobium sp. 41S5]UFX42743.1 MFS transporter [Bradyrhizobium sp. 41S5]